MPVGVVTQLSRAISVETVWGEKFKSGGQYVAGAMIAGEGDTFTENVQKAFDKLSQLPSGRALIDEMDNSGHTCVIFCGSNAGMDVYMGAAILADSADKRATLDRYALPMSDYATMLVSDNLDNSVNKDEILGSRKAKVNEYYNGVFNRNEISLNDTNIVFQAVYNEIERRFFDATAYIASATGYSATDIDKFRFGETRIGTSDNFRLSLGLYDHIIRGAGADTAVRLTLNIGIKSADAKAKWYHKVRGKDRYSLSNENVRADVMLGHELVHAWRMMTGRRIVASGWEEEMMTVGLPPAANFRFTENRFRLEAGHPIRTSYNLTATTLAGMSMKG